MTPRKQRESRTTNRDAEGTGFYFQNLPSSYKDDIPDLSLSSLEDEINLSRFLIKVFFDDVMASAPDLKELGEAIYRIGTTVMKVSQLLSIHRKLEGDSKPINQLQKALEEILSDVQATSLKQE